jgi:hypothetical protein
MLSVMAVLSAAAFVALAGLCVSLREFSQCALRLVFSGTELYSLPHAVARLSANQASLASACLAIPLHCGRYTVARPGRWPYC